MHVTIREIKESSVIVNLGEMQFEVVSFGNVKKYFPRNKEAKLHIFVGYRHGLYNFDEKLNHYLTKHEFKLLKRCVSFSTFVDKILSYVVG